MPHPLQDHSLHGHWPVLLVSSAMVAAGFVAARDQAAFALGTGLWIGHCAGYGLLALAGRRIPARALPLAAWVLLAVAVAWGAGLLVDHALLAHAWQGAQIALHLAFQATLLGVPVLQGAGRARAWQRSETERLRVVAELRGLQAQIEPHFLFNTLAALRSLVRQRADEALPLLDHVTGFLQAVLPDVRQAESTLERELKIVEQYLGIMAIRLGGRLQFAIDVRLDPADLSIAPLLLQPLVENAVQHGVEPSEHGGRIDVVAARDGAVCLIDVINSGAPLEAAAATSQGHGLALNNLRRRLVALHGPDDRARFCLERLDDGRTRARLVLPIR